MEFTYQAYHRLLASLEEGGYPIRNYHNYKDTSRCAILRHDIDHSLPDAVKLAELEADTGVSSTYFVLLRTDFYNIASKAGQEALHHIQSLGHQIGLHFDETAYASALSPDEIVQNIIKECGLLETSVSSVSMHRPSESILGADLQIPGIVNSYGKYSFGTSNTSPTAVGTGGNRWMKSSVPGNTTGSTF